LITKKNWKEIKANQVDTLYPTKEYNWNAHIAFRPVLKQQNNDYFNNNIVPGMFNLFARVQTENILLKHQLLSKIRGLKVGIGVDATTILSSTVFKSLVFAIAKEIDGIILNNGNSFLNFEEKIILNLKGESNVQELVGVNLRLSQEQLIIKESAENWIEQDWDNNSTVA
jgi:hypothetical protein